MTERDEEFDWDDLDWDDDSLSVDDESGVELPSDNTPPQGGRTAELADGRVLALSGHDAGREILDDGAQADFRLSSRDSALDGATPILMVHRPHQGAETTPRLMASILGRTRGSVAMAAVVNLLSMTPTTSRTWLGEQPAAAIHVADPTCFLLDPSIVRVKAITSLARRHHPALVTDPVDIAAVLDSQRAVGANLLLTSGRALDPGSPQRALDAACTEGDAALSVIESGERLALNLTMPAMWLQSEPLRAQLLDQLVDQEQFPVWYVRVQFPPGRKPPLLPADNGLLRGLRRLAQLAADEGRTLLLPQSGLTGWLQLAFGASGFGTGLFGSSQAFQEPSGGGGGHDRVERYFEPSLLTVVDRAVHEMMLAEPDYLPCDCPYCMALHASAGWSHRLADLHHVYWAGILAAETSTGGRMGPIAPVRRRAAGALSTVTGRVLPGSNELAHLRAWDQLL